MKKMMFVAVMMSAMLMPAQMMAKNNREYNKPKVENRMDRFEKNRPNKAYDKRFRDDRFNKKPMPMAKMRRPAPRHRPMPKPMPKPRPRPVPRPVYHNHCCDNDAVETAATIIGIAALAAMMAD